MLRIDNIFQKRVIDEERDFVYNDFKSSTAFEQEFKNYAINVYDQLSKHEYVMISDKDDKLKNFLMYLDKECDVYMNKFILDDVCLTQSDYELWYNRMKHRVYGTVWWFYTQVYKISI